MKPKPANADRLRITVQYRTKRGKTYELTSHETVLAVHISAPDDGGGESERAWHVEARLGTQGGDSLAEGWGATAAEALSETARAWVLRSPQVTAFDWEAVTRELQGVHAV